MNSLELETTLEFLTGGSLVKFEFESGRATEDIDIVRIRHDTLSDEASRNELYRWLIQRGSGPEWVNTAVEPFLNEVPDWKKEVVLIRNGSAGNIFRPSLTLFIFLKLRRGTPIDFQDIGHAIKHCPEGVEINKLKLWGSAPICEKYRKIAVSFGLPPWD
ncbi:hypothetical protein WDW86_15370 [Bdellovibrionota bacterium FG-2]